ncbi:hypothetical protein FRC15_004596 [Serendipita sp. 397]|nr:hypothetical protein FRC15_004596 [Serendipita sp. 397]KAG8776967.1 hypothetical protein FRC16_004342 [Serendipita sp. 398]
MFGGEFFGSEDNVLFHPSLRAKDKGLLDYLAPQSRAHDIAPTMTGKLEIPERLSSSRRLTTRTTDMIPRAHYCNARYKCSPRQLFGMKSVTIIRHCIDGSSVISSLGYLTPEL